LQLNSTSPPIESAAPLTAKHNWSASHLLGIQPGRADPGRRRREHGRAVELDRSGPPHPAQSASARQLLQSRFSAVWRRCRWAWRLFRRRGYMESPPSGRRWLPCRGGGQPGAV